MKVSTCNNLIKNTLITLLLSAQAYSPVLSKVEDVPSASQQAFAQREHSKGPEDVEEQDIVQEDLIKIFMAIRETVREKLMHPLLSRIDTLKLMVSNDRKNILSLNTQQKKDFVAKINGIHSVVEKHKAIFNSLDPQDLAVAVQLAAQITDYLALAIAKQLRNINSFEFKFEQKRAPTHVQGMIEDLFKEVTRVEALDDALQELGVSNYEKFKRKLSALNKKYNVDKILMGTGLVTFLALYARYKTKPFKPGQSGEPQFSELAKEAMEYAEAIKHMADPVQKQQASQQLAQMLIDSRRSLIHVPTPPPAPETLPWWKRGFNKGLDAIDAIVGDRPIETTYTEKKGNLRIQRHDPGVGSGLFGTIATYITPLLAVVGFMSIAKGTSDEFGTHVKHWKAFKNNPKGFVKWEEMWGNEQKVSPIEELFLLNALERVEPRITFDDITGLREQKQELQMVINYLLYPDLFEKTGTTFETGYLFYGPTRTGKTLLAEALAGELIHKYKKPLVFFKIRGSELRFVGIKKILEIVKKYAPCICFIDELDLLNLQRDQNTSLLDEFLTSMKNDGKKQVIFLAATNRIDHIDHALLQPGRFGKILTFENPSLNDRKDYFKHELVAKNIFDPSLDVDKLAQETENCSFGDLSSIINDAVAQATQKRQKLSYKHFDSAIDSFKRRINDSLVNIPEEERRLIAVHLSGHALGFALLGTSEVLHKVTMLPIQKRVTEEKIWLSDLTTAKKITYYGDVFTLHKTNTAGFDTAEQKINYVKVLLAGHLAEKLILGSTSYSYHNEDNEKARQMLETLVFKGIKKENLSKEDRNRKQEEVVQLFNQYEAEVTQFLADNKDKLVKIVDALQQRLTLTSQEVQALIADAQPMAAPAA